MKKTNNYLRPIIMEKLMKEFFNTVTGYDSITYKYLRKDDYDDNGLEHINPYTFDSHRETQQDNTSTENDRQLRSVSEELEALRAKYEELRQSQAAAPVPTPPTEVDLDTRRLDIDL
jgi:hypothetical protein